MEGQIAEPGGRSAARGLSSFRFNLARRDGLFAPAGLVLSFTILGLVLRLIRLDFQPLWWDEGYSAWFATHSLGQMAALTAEDIHPPLYYALLHLWTLIAGPGPISLRLVSVAAGVAAIPMIYAATMRIFGSRRVALLAAFLLAINPLHVYYSQEVRMYGLVALLSTGMLWAAWGVLHTKPGQTGFPQATQSHETRFVSAAYVVLTTLALYTQYYAVFLPVGLTLYAVWHWRRTPRLLVRWFGLQATVALLYLPWVIYAGPRLTLYVGQKVVADADRPLGLIAYFGRHLAAFTAGHLEGALAVWWPAALVLLAPVLWGLITRVMKVERGRAKADESTKDETRNEPNSPGGAVGPDAIALLATVLLTALVLGWLIGLRYPFFPDRGERLLLLALPAFVMLAAAGLVALTDPGARERDLSGFRNLTGLGTRAKDLSAFRNPTSLGTRAKDLSAFRNPTGLGTRAKDLSALRNPTSLGTRAKDLSGFGNLTGLATALFAAVSVVSLVFFYTVPRYPGDDYRPLIARTVEQGLPGDTVFCIYPWQVGYWRSYAASADGPAAILAPSVKWDATLQSALDQALARGHVWFPAHLALGGILETRTEQYLASRAIPFANTWYGPGTRLSGWQAVPAEQAPSAAAASGTPIATYPVSSGELALTAAPPPSRPVPAANAVAPITLSWQAPARPELAVSVRLVDDLGQIWAQNDYEPLGAMVGSSGDAGNDAGWQAVDRFGLLVPAGTPPGRYSVELVLLPPNDDRPLTAQVSGQPPASSVPLFEIEVTPASTTLTPDRLPITRAEPTGLGDGLSFLGFTLDDTPLAPGELRRLSLFWQATGQPAGDWTAFVQLLGKDGSPVAAWEAPPGASYPTSQWQRGTLMRTQAYFRPGAELADGRYVLIAGLFRPSDGARMETAKNSDSLALGFVQIKGRPRDTTAPKPEYAADATFGSVARLVGYDVAAGGGQITLYWEALGATERPYTVFVHVLDDQGQVVGYGDGEPGNGAYPTTGWRKGEYLVDTHTLRVQRNAGLRAAIGLYDPSTGERLTTQTGDDATILILPK